MAPSELQRLIQLQVQRPNSRRTRVGDGRESSVLRACCAAGEVPFWAGEGAQ